MVNSWLFYASNLAPTSDNVPARTRLNPRRKRETVPAHFNRSPNFCETFGENYSLLNFNRLGEYGHFPSSFTASVSHFTSGLFLKCFLSSPSISLTKS